CDPRRTGRVTSPSLVPATRTDAGRAGSRAPGPAAERPAPASARAARCCGEGHAVAGKVRWRAEARSACSVPRSARRLLRSDVAANSYRPPLTSPAGHDPRYGLPAPHGDVIGVAWAGARRRSEVRPDGCATRGRGRRLAPRPGSTACTGNTVGNGSTVGIGSTVGTGGSDTGAAVNRLGCVLESSRPLAVLRLSGPLDLASSVELRMTLQKALAEQPSGVVVDVAALTVQEDIALTVFSAFARTAAAWPACPVVLCAPPAEVNAALNRLAISRS